MSHESMSPLKVLMFLPFLFLGLLAGCDQSQTPEQQSAQQSSEPATADQESETAEPESEVAEKVQPGPCWP